MEAILSDNDIMKPPTCPVKDCSLPIDIVLRSSDGIELGAHMRNLEHYSEAFPQSGSVEVNSEAEAVTLDETGDVLELMLQFMHLTRQPELAKISFDLLSGLAEAVEKYMIYSAMSMCKLYMGYALKEHPLDVLMYSSKHNYDMMANECAPLTLKYKSETVVRKANEKCLHDSFLLKWFRCRDIHNQAVRTILKADGIYSKKSNGSHHSCGLWDSLKKEVQLESFKFEFATIQDIRDLIDTKSSSVLSCVPCTRAAHEWRSQAKQAVIPVFSDM
ncbi:hypothetical protein BDN70DRAFT_838249 [Pholiota conissans]|uniref:BTB domain-containing protein n=1 Tax=Pholiota conissans TaxID=109636 RepID=A0A9P6CYZ0_9AGAR|nr:hypothetical protein BDN70DRAFT_838249 [Pholiota conissans]